MQLTNTIFNGLSLRHRLATLAVLALVATAGADETRLLNIKDRVVTRNERVTLAELTDSTANLSSTEQAIAVFDAPPVGENRRMTLVEVAFALQKFPELLDINLKGATAIVIEHAASSENQQQSKARIIACLKRTAPWSAWKLDVLFQADDERKLAWPRQAVDVEVKPQESSAVLGKVPLRVAFLDANAVRLSECSIAPVILRELQVVVMATTKDRGTVLGNEDLQTMPMWSGGEESSRMQYITDISACSGHELSKAMNAGDILQPKFLLNPVCVKRGDLIWIEAKSGQLTIRLAGNALEGGRLGETIRVRNPSSTKEFSARITGDKRASVDMNP